MGYACPVCGDPQADAEHLANHLAFTAMLGDGDHESWLDEHVPDWGDRDPDALAAAVTEGAEETRYPQVFEDTTGDHDHGQRQGHEHDHDRGDPAFAAEARERARRDRDDDAADVMAEARELTREMLGSATGEGGSESEADGDGEAETQ